MSDLAINKRQYQRLVKVGREAVREHDRQQWVLGDLAVEVAALGRTRNRTGAYALLKQWASDIGMQFETVRAYRSVAAAWPTTLTGRSGCVGWLADGGPSGGPRPHSCRNSLVSRLKCVLSKVCLILLPKLSYPAARVRSIPVRREKWTVTVRSTATMP